ncbi:MAG: sialidase family protein [Bacteroidales bacterium]
MTNRQLPLLTLAILAIFPGIGQEIKPKEPPAFQVVRQELILSGPPFIACHASTLVELGDDRLVVAFFGGSYEGSPDVKIWGTIRTGDNWSDPFILADGQVNDTLVYPCWNPVLFRTSQDELLLFYKVGSNPREWFGMMKRSIDNGRNWSAPLRLPEGILGPIRCKPVELAGGLLLCPSSVETADRWYVQMEILDLASGRWQSIPVDPEGDFQVIQPTIIRMPGDSLRILCRSKHDAVLFSDSGDGGRSWSPFAKLPLDNPNAGIDAITRSDGTHLLVYNPLPAGQEWWLGRNRLNLAWSADGTHWQDLLELENREQGEYSYPAIIVARGGRILISYTYERRNVRFWEIVK